MSHLFTPFRAIGAVTADVPLHVDLFKNVVVASVGRTYHTYTTSSLRLIGVGDVQVPTPISAVAGHKKHHIMGSGNRIYVFLRKTLKQTLEHSPIGHVTHLVAHDTVLVSVGYDNTMVTWVRDEDHLYRRYGTIVLPHDVTCSAVCVPSHYVNKVLLGSHQGALHLFNVRTKNHIHVFKSFHSPIHSLVAAPFQDVVAVGLADGRVVVHNIGADTTLFTFRHVPASPVTALSFRLDGPQMLASGTQDGEIAIWNLDDKRLDLLLTNTKGVDSSDAKNTNPHQGAVTTLAWLGRAPRLLTAGADNCIRIYGFARLGEAIKVVERQGHFLPLTCASFYDEDQLITTSEDRTIRMTNVRTGAFNQELSQGTRKQARADATLQSVWDMRLPPVTALASCPLKAPYWPALLTCHQNLRAVHTWRMDNRTLDALVLAPPRGANAGEFTDNHATAVCLSRCGGFGVVGMSDGMIATYSIQAQKYNLTFGGAKARAHRGPVTGLHFTASNREVVSTSEDRTIKVWSHRTGALLRELYTGYALTHASYSPATHLLAVACDDNSARLFDVNLLHQVADVKDPTPAEKPVEAPADETEGETAAEAEAPPVVTPVRHFRGHTAALTATTFSPDSAFFVTASLDLSMRVHHISTNQLVDLYRFEQHITSLSFHPASLFLSTTHHGVNCVFLWTNHLKYGLVPRIIQEEADILEAPAQSLPTGRPEQPEGIPLERSEIATDADAEVEDGAAATADSGTAEGPAITTLTEPEAGSLLVPKPGLLTLSGTPWPKWASLPHVEVIRRRNRPTVGPKATRAPFFMMTTPGLQPKFKFDDDDEAEAPPNKRRRESHRLTAQDFEDYATPFLAHLRKKRFKEAFELLIGMSTGRVDTELRDIENPADLSALLRCLLRHLRGRQYFEVVQAVLAVVLRVHAEKLSRDGPLAVLAAEVLAAQQECREALDRLIHYNLCLVKSATKAL